MNLTDNTTYISERAPEELKEYLISLGRSIEIIHRTDAVAPPIADHPDVYMCRLGIDDSSKKVFADESELSPVYPGDVPYNAACTGIFFMHSLGVTSPRLLKAAQELGMSMIDVRQGYAKCSTVIVDERSVITYDSGIAAACEKQNGPDVLLVEPGHVLLDGYGTGFIGGTSGRTGDKVIFNGDLSEHPDHERIRDFIEARGLECVWFDGYPLTDIGSII